MGFKGTRCRTACIFHKHRCLHFHEISSGKEITDFTENLGALHKNRTAIFIHDEIHIALAITGIRILQTVELFRKRIEGLGEQNNLLPVNGNLTCLGLKHKAGNFYNISYIQLLIGLVFLFSKTFPTHIDLNLSVSILHMKKSGLSHDTFCHNTTGNHDLLIFQSREVLFNLCRVMRLLRFGNNKRVRLSVL